MKVYELIEKLNNYNPNADVCICVNGMPKEFEICYGTSEGCTPANCDSVDFMVETPSDIFELYLLVYKLAMRQLKENT